MALRMVCDLSPPTWFGLVRNSHCCPMLSINGLATSVMPTPVKTIPEPAFWVLLKTGDAEPEDQGKAG